MSSHKRSLSQSQDSTSSPTTPTNSTPTSTQKSPVTSTTPPTSTQNRKSPVTSTTPPSSTQNRTPTLTPNRRLIANPKTFTTKRRLIANPYRSPENPQSRSSTVTPQDSTLTSTPTPSQGSSQGSAELVTIRKINIQGLQERHKDIRLPRSYRNVKEQEVEHSSVGKHTAAKNLVGMYDLCLF